jgi:BolA protein
MSDLLSTMDTKLRAAFPGADVRVENESHLHAGHGGAAEHKAEFGDVPSHAHVAVTADAFRDMSRLARHRAVMDAIAEEVARLHALRLTLELPDS